LSNPPFGGGKYDDPAGLAVATAAIPRLQGRRRLDPSLVGLVRAVDLLAPGGVLGIVLPDGVVASADFADLVLGNSGGPARAVSLAASVSLPSATFALTGTVARTTAVFLRRAPRPSRVALARVEHVGYLRQGGRAAPDPAGDELPAVSRLVRQRLGGDDTTAPSSPLVVVVPSASLTTLDPSTLDPARHDPAALAARQWLLDHDGLALRDLIVPVAAARARTVTTPFVSVLHVDDLGTVDWAAARAYTPTTPGILASPGQLVVSLLNPSRLRAAVIPSGWPGPVQVSAEFGVFATEGDPYAVLGLLYSPRVRAQLRPLGSGTSSSRRRIGADDVLSVIVPRLGPTELAGLGRGVREATEQVDAGRHRLIHLFDATAGQRPSTPPDG
jgi:hypothetical protein